MAKETVKDQEALQQEKIAEQVSKTEQFFNENKKTIWGVLAAVVVVGLGILGYQQFIYKPKVAEALSQVYHAENAFANNDFETALNGDGNNLGFAEVASEYGAKAGKAVYFYAGVCELQLGNYSEAINYLKKYNGKDNILAARALACIGDSYVGLEDYASALSYFEKAANKSNNVFSAAYLLKAGAVCEEMGNDAKALEFYKAIKDQYPSSIEGYDIDKYITRIENK